MKKVMVINGPNLNRLGGREPEVYGTETLEEIEGELLRLAETLGVELEFRHSNIEGEIVDFLQEADDGFDGLIINPGAYTHYSLAIHDALRALSKPSIEVHLSNIFAREDYRHKMLTTAACSGIIGGLGSRSYSLALRALAEILR